MLMIFLSSARIGGLYGRWKMSDLGPVKHYLGIMNMLKRFGMENCAPKPTLMDDKIQLDIDNAGENLTGKPLSKTDKEHF